MTELRDAVGRRSAALAAGDASALEALLHPAFRWTSHRGEVFDRAGARHPDLGPRAGEWLCLAGHAGPLTG
ncbi:DUF4440 domain-containing protein [Cryptosporangium arvum]|uniref:DUF4440 domain-containing protein n=1 Tax=Cryptosporangium arvum TaxID=80871 RepID=UPI0004AFDBCE|nr:DUF4440 domain-containing protein [Cryptosporangium arvum]